MTNEIAALAEAAADAADRLGVTTVQTMHAAIARRVFANTPASAPARVIHAGVAGATYAAVRGGVTAAGLLAAAVERRAATGADVRPVSRSPRGRFLVGVLNGVSGDRLVETDNELAVRMSVRREGADVPCTRAALRCAFPRATPAVVVFLHGLAETEEWWQRRRRDASGQVRPPYGVQLQADCGLTPVYVRYNTGLHVSENGRNLARLLDELVAAWPVPVERLVLIGHSMGGLVVRSACHAGGEAGHAWPQLVRELVTLGSPHHGAPIAKAIHLAAWLLRQVPEASAFADILDLRSAGVRDMRFGALHDDDWRDEDGRALQGDQRRIIPLHAACRHTFITATLTPAADHPVGWLLGDLLVRTDSAGGRCREHTIPVPPESVVHLGGLSHFDLLDHPAVYDVLRGALSPGSRRPASSG